MLLCVYHDVGFMLDPVPYAAACRVHHRSHMITDERMTSLVDQDIRTTPASLGTTSSPTLP